MRVLLISFLALVGCASAISSGPQAARSAKAAPAACEDLGREVFNARNPVLNPTQTMGPSEVTWLRPKPTGYLTVIDGHLFRCSHDS